jgi:methyl-accepting chemotaxis protein
MKLESKLGISTGVLILAMLASALVAHIRVQEANRLANSVADGRIPIICRAREVRSAMMTSVRSLETYMLLGVDQASSLQLRQRRADDLNAGEKPLAQLLQLSSSFDLGPDASRIQQIQPGLAQLRSLEEDVERLNEMHTPAASSQARILLQTQILSLDSTLFASMGVLIESQEKKCDADMDALQQANRSVLITLWTVTLFGALLGGFLSFLLARRITRGIRLVASRADAIASGDLTGSELDIHSSDQIGSLAHAMQQMQSGLGSIIGTVSDTAGSLTASAATMSATTDKIHRRVDEQAQQTQQAATAMQQMSASIAEVSRHSQSAAQTARSAAQTAHEGDAIVKQMLVSMHSIAAAVSDTSAAVGLLGDDSRRISQIVTVIDEIARKTNLLALNAAIEAARAGEAGRGFAVVADEVRRLADRSKTLASDISQITANVQVETSATVLAMDKGAEQLKDGLVLMEHVAEASSGIRLATQQQQSATEQVVEAMEQVRIASQQVSTTAQELALASGSQATMAGDLKLASTVVPPAPTTGGRQPKASRPSGSGQIPATDGRRPGAPSQPPALALPPTDPR